MDEIIKNIRDFVEFEAETSEVYPWAMDKEKVLSKVKEIANICESDTSDDIYFAIDKICGINPQLIV